MALSFSSFNRRGYPTIEVREGYREWSRSYDQDVDEELDIDLLSRLSCFEWDRAARAVDLACGTGRIGVWLKRQGVGKLTGVDSSMEMLRFAESKGVYDQLIHQDMRSTTLKGLLLTFALAFLPHATYPISVPFTGRLYGY
jgi:trans-aconitate methyltransferase